MNTGGKPAGGTRGRQWTVNETMALAMAYQALEERGQIDSVDQEAHIQVYYATKARQMKAQGEWLEGTKGEPNVEQSIAERQSRGGLVTRAKDSLRGEVVNCIVPIWNRMKIPSGVQLDVHMQNVKQAYWEHWKMGRERYCLLLFACCFHLLFSIRICFAGRRTRPRCLLLGPLPIGRCSRSSAPRA